MESPVTAGVIPKVSVPVPPDAVNAVEESARPKVVVIPDPPAITIAPLMTILIVV